MKHIYHFDYNPNTVATFAEQSKRFQQSLADLDSEAVKTKQPFGKVITLDIAPKYFLAPATSGFSLYALFDLIASNDQSTFISEEDWYKEHHTIAKTKKKYHPAYKNICPVLRNAPKNPIWLVGDSNHATATYITKIVATRYKDESCSYYFETQRATVEDNVLSVVSGANYTLSFSALPPHHSFWSYRMSPRSGWSNVCAARQAEMKVNGEPNTNAAPLIDLIDLLTNQFLYKDGYSLHKAYKVFHRYLDQDLAYWFKGCNLNYQAKPINEKLHEWYDQLRDNPEFYDLPFDEIQLLNLYNNLKDSWVGLDQLAEGYRSEVLKYLQAGDTKSAVDACFFGYVYPQSIRKILIKIGLLAYPKHVYGAIHNCIEKVGVDKTLMFITDINNAGEPDLGLISNVVLIEAVAAGFNINIIKTLQKKGASQKILDQMTEKFKYIADTMYMYERLMANNIPLVFKSKNIDRVHFYLVNIYTLYGNISSDAEMSAVESVDTSEQTETYKAGEYTIRSPYTASELIKVGTDMSHCVAIYVQRFFYRQTEILLLVDKKDRYIACIEVLDSYVIQAKLSYDRPLHANTEYLDIVLAYIAQRNLKTASIDFGPDQTFYKIPHEYYPSKDSERKRVVAALDALNQQIAMSDS